MGLASRFQRRSQMVPSQTTTGRGPVFICGLATTAMLAVFFFFQPNFLELVNHRIYDTLLVSIPHQPPSDLSVIVDIDDRSLKTFGQWPWPRYRIAQLLEKIKSLGARSIALDMIFPESDRTSFDHLQKQMMRDFDLHIDLSGYSERLINHDTLFAQTLATGPYVLGYKFIFEENLSPTAHCRLHSVPIIIKRSSENIDNASPLLASADAVCNLPTLSAAVTQSGFINAKTDSDGALRRVPLLMSYKCNGYPSLALAAMIRAFGAQQLVLKTSAYGIEELVWRDRSIPLDEKGNLLIRFRGPQNTFAHISASQVLNGQVAPKEIKDRIVFVGTSAAGLIDFHATPFDPVYPGVEAHAAIVDNLIQGDFITSPRWMRGLELMLGVVAGLLSALLMAHGRAMVSIVIFITSAGLMWGGSSLLLNHRGLFISPFVPLAAFAINFSFLSALKYWREERAGKKRTEELAMVQAVTLETIATVIETRHTETGGHIKRTQHYVRHLAQYLQRDEKYRSQLNAQTVKLLFQSSPLHDVGKVGVPDAILKKAGKLTPEEFEVMKRHTIYGKLMFDEAEAKLGENSFLSIARTIAYTHHEKWNGSGYPLGLQRENIPLYGRIMAIADIYDALISKRLYKNAMAHEDAVAYISKISGTELDPNLVDAFLNLQAEFRQVAALYSDDKGGHLNGIAA